MKLTSKERIDILPGTSREIRLNEEIADADKLQGTSMKEGYVVLRGGKDYIEILNNTRQTYSIFPNDAVAELQESVAEMKSEEVAEAFVVEEGTITCPLCGKEYTDTPQGE